MANIRQTTEHRRLSDARETGVPWRKWGPYLSERQWGTVREDYSEGGDAWSYFSHDQARSRAYRWGEDGLAGSSDDKQRLCFAIALWNEKDPILKERLFGLTNSEGNHGEDVKEYYYYLDSTPTHAYMKWLYKYPQEPYPYADLVNTNRSRSRTQFEYELLDTGVFYHNRYWDVMVEYAKASPDDLLIRISATNRGPDPATLHVLPTLWFRNTWWHGPDQQKPALNRVWAPSPYSAIEAAHPELGTFWLSIDGESPMLFTENETNTERVFGTPSELRYVKDAFHRYLIEDRQDLVNPTQTGTKAAFHQKLTVEPGRTGVLNLRLTAGEKTAPPRPFDDFTAIFDARRREADEFYQSITPRSTSADAANVMRQAYAGLLWGKQYYAFDAIKWLDGHGAGPFAPSRREVRNREWSHMVNDDVISMPDKWEYPWYAAWDLAFQSVALAAVDVDFAKGQLDLMLRDVYLHPSGQIPAYEWNFGDVNPPVHAWASLFLHRTQQAL
jgi:hypothetical protein